MSLASRLQHLRGKQSRRSFAEYLGVTESTLRNYESGASSPNAEFLLMICQKMQIGVEWLLLGVGNMHGQGGHEEAGACNGAVEVFQQLYRRDILHDVVETLEEILDEMGRTLSAEAKAEVVCDLYELIEEGEASHSSVRPMRILKLIKGALAANE